MEQRDPGPKGSTARRQNNNSSARTHFLRDNPGTWFVWSGTQSCGNVRSALNTADPGGEYEMAIRVHDVFVRYIGRKGDR